MFKRLGIAGVALAATLSASGPSGGDRAAPPGSPSLVVAGDIARCDLQGDEATARLVEPLDALVLIVGDLAYPDNKGPGELERCFEPSWGRFKSRIRPVPGNHEYDRPGAAPYFRYFGTAGGRPGEGYYSFDLDGWHIVALNSNVPAEASSPQLEWLRRDLAANPARCTLAYWHHPVFSSGDHGGQSVMRTAWRMLQEAGADVVLAGHDHSYERFAPQTVDGERSDERGIRQFVVGTGGAPLYPWRTTAPNSEAKNNRTHGVLALSLYPDRYEWEFVATDPERFRDRGESSCR